MKILKSQVHVISNLERLIPSAVYFELFKKATEYGRVKKYLEANTLRISENTKQLIKQEAIRRFNK